MTDRRTLGLIPARGGSKGVPGKNVRELAGVPLLGYSVRAGQAADCVDSVVVSTDDNEIAEVARECGARVPFRRPVELATDETPTEPVIEHALETLAGEGESYDEVVLLQPTSPLRTATHVEEAYQLYHERDADSLLSGVPSTEIRWRRTEHGAEQVNYTDAAKRRQDRTPEYVINGAVYVTATKGFRATGEITHGRTALYEMDRIHSVDIDTPFDLWLAGRIVEDWQNDARDQ